MAEVQGFERRLAAVLMLDVAGYSRLMGLDEETTHRRFRDKMRGFVGRSIAAAGGRIVKGTGDGLLVEFPNVAAAVACGVHLQKLNDEAEADQPVEHRIRFRIGISHGDIIVDEGDIYGDGVNIAARLEGIADVGGVCVSEAVALASAASGFACVDLGLKHLKNISRPIRVYKIALSGESPVAGRPVGASLVSGFGERPAIAVLPFRLLGAGHDAAHLADGITEDVIVALSRWRHFPVISRAAVFAFKGKDLDVKFIGQQLGARYLTEGTLRRHDSRLRATVQLEDAETTENLFANQYDYEIGEAFAAHDEIVRTIVGAIEPELLRYERERIVRTPQQDATAYELFQRGQWHHYRYTQADNQQARAFFRHALALDPNYAQAAAALSIALGVAAHSDWESDAKATHDEALGLAQHSVHEDPLDPLAHFALGLAFYHSSRTQEVRQGAERGDPPQPELRGGSRQSGIHL